MAATERAIAVSLNGCLVFKRPVNRFEDSLVWIRDSERGRRMEAWEAGDDSGLYGGVGADTAVAELLERVRSVDAERRIEAAREIRWLTKTSSKNRRQLSGAVDPLVSMLRSESPEGTQAAILALLNLAVKDER